MKISVIGFAGSGKSTLTKVLAKHYNIPYLYLDSVQFKENWIERDPLEFETILSQFLTKNDDWVIDGNYVRKCPERFNESDLIIYLNYNRFFCLKEVLKRNRKNKNKVRESMATGCIEKIDFEFVKWVLHKGRTKKKKKRLLDICKNNGNYIVFKSRRKLKKYLKKHSIQYEFE